MPQPLALGALHPTAVWLGLGRLHVRPELWLRHGHQGRGWDGQVVMVLMLLRLVLRRRLVLGRGLVRRLERRLVLRLVLRLGLGLLRLRLMWRWQRRMQWPLQARLGVCGQERLPRARQEGLSWRKERPCGC